MFLRRELGCTDVLLLQYDRFHYDQDKSTADKLNHPIESKESLTFSGEDYLQSGFLCHTGYSFYSPEATTWPTKRTPLVPRPGGCPGRGDILKCVKLIFAIDAKRIRTEKIPNRMDKQPSHVYNLLG